MIRVVGIGNELRRDDGFGPRVARRLAATDLPPGVVVSDHGIRGVHLAFDLLDHDGPVVFVDAVGRGDPPGTVTLLLPDLEALPTGALDGHDLDLAGVVAAVHAIGGALEDVVLVGCEPDDLGDGIELTPPVAAAIDVAVDLLHEIITMLTASPDERSRDVLARRTLGAGGSGRGRGGDDAA